MNILFMRLLRNGIMHICMQNKHKKKTAEAVSEQAVGSDLFDGEGRSVVHIDPGGQDLDIGSPGTDGFLCFSTGPAAE